MWGWASTLEIGVQILNKQWYLVQNLAAMTYCGPKGFQAPTRFFDVFKDTVGASSIKDNLNLRVELELFRPNRLCGKKNRKIRKIWFSMEIGKLRKRRVFLPLFVFSNFLKVFCNFQWNQIHKTVKSNQNPILIPKKLFLLL